jgi:hypothetical protein
MPHLKKPKNQKAEVLRLLINRRSGVSERDTVLNGFRARISKLNEDLNIQFKVIPFTTTLGKKSDYRRHFIIKEDLPTAIEFYNKINK